jgi:hypothetical protein
MADHEPTAMPTAHPLSAEIRTALVARKVEDEIVNRICNSLDEITNQASACCPLCAIEYEHAEKLGSVLRKIDGLLDSVFVGTRRQLNHQPGESDEDTRGCGHRVHGLLHGRRGAEAERAAGTGEHNPSPE